MQAIATTAIDVKGRNIGIIHIVAASWRIATINITRVLWNIPSICIVGAYLGLNQYYLELNIVAIAIAAIVANIVSIPFVAILKQRLHFLRLMQ